MVNDSEPAKADLEAGSGDSGATEAADSSESTNLKKALFQVSDGILGAAILIFLGVMGGNWLDAKLHTSPWLSIALSMLGGGLGLYRLVRKAMLIGDMPSSSGLRRKPKGSKTTKPGSDSSAPTSQTSSGPRPAYQKWDDEED
jgi:F0F1-type ATP synthase assembly protein I